MLNVNDKRGATGNINAETTEKVRAEAAQTGRHVYVRTSSQTANKFVHLVSLLTFETLLLMTGQTESQLKCHVTLLITETHSHTNTHVCQATGAAQLPHLHVFLLQDGGLLGEDLIGLDALQALLPLLLLQRRGPLTVY